MTPKNKILIISDNPNILLSVEFLLSKMRFEVFVARNGMEAIEIIENKLIDLILLDIMMQNVNAFKIYEVIKNHKSSISKIITLAANDKQLNMDLGQYINVDLHLIKPFSTRTLLKKIKKLLRD